MVPFLQLVLSNLVVATLIALLAWQVGRSGRRARVAHVLWVIFFVKLITPPLVLLPITVPSSWMPESSGFYGTYSETFPYVTNVVVDAPSVHLSDSLVNQAETIAPVSPRQLIPHIHFGLVLFAVWICGFSVVLLRVAIRFVRFHQLIHREGVKDDKATEFVDQLIARSTKWGRPRRGPDVLRLPIRVSPMLFGFGRRAVVVCPDQLWTELSQSDRHAFLAHESAHFSRRDHWIRWLEWIVTAVYWWFPLVYIARTQLERHEEACCDAWAVRQLETPPRKYAEALLQVVDFISEHNVGIPRLASGMQPTATMEERLRLVMHPRNDEELISPLRVMASATCLSLWLLHPVPSADISDTDVSVAELDSDTSQSTSRKKAELGTRQNSASAFSMSEIGLPGAPTGFWNAKPERKWADFSLAMPGSRLIASAGSGMRIQSPGTPEIAFSHEDLSAIVNLPANRRVVIGDAAGRLRLWDLNDGVPVSLIGQHAAKVTSIAHHESIGLVAGDDGGSVMRWDLQSGQVLATWSSKMIHGVQNEAGLLDGISASGTAEPPAVQSVRFSKDGSIMAILTGRWSKFDREQKVFFVESRSLKTLGSIDLELGTAVVLASPEYGWVSIDWSGVMKSIETRATLTTLNKPRVSAIVLCSTTLDPKRDVLN